MEADANIEIKELRVDGGATENDLLMQFQADILKTKILRSQTAEVTALGAAYLAGLGSGYWKNISEVEEKWEESRAYNPENINLEELINGWKRAIKAANSWSSN